jgi:hypothetical protein
MHTAVRIDGHLNGLEQVSNQAAMYKSTCHLDMLLISFNCAYRKLTAQQCPFAPTLQDQFSVADE